MSSHVNGRACLLVCLMLVRPCLAEDRAQVLPLQLAQAVVTPAPAEAAGDAGASPAAPDAAAGPQTSTRSLFMSLFLTNFVPTIASSLADWFTGKSDASAGARRGDATAAATGTGSGTGSRRAEVVVAAAADAPRPPSAAGPSPADSPSAGQSSQSSQAGGAQTLRADADADAAVAPLHAGVAYQVLLVDQDGKRSLVDPSHLVFATGQQFEIAYRPNFPGLVEVVNEDSAGKTTLVDRVMLEATALQRLGPYQFTGRKGTELLRIALYPCATAAMQDTASRGIVKVDMRVDVVQRLTPCDQAAPGPTTVAMRSITKVVQEGRTAYALDPVSNSEMQARRIAPRQVEIRFEHQ